MPGVWIGPDGFPSLLCGCLGVVRAAVIGDQAVGRVSCGAGFGSAWVGQVGSRSDLLRGYERQVANLVQQVARGGHLRVLGRLSVPRLVQCILNSRKSFTANGLQQVGGEFLEGVVAGRDACFDHAVHRVQ